VLDVKDFFANFYVPNNASLVVWGTLIRQDQTAGGAALRHDQARPGSDPQDCPPVKLDKVLRATTLDQVQLSKISIVYHSRRTSPRAMRTWTSVRPSCRRERAAASTSG